MNNLGKLKKLLKRFSLHSPPAFVAKKALNGSSEYFVDLSSFLHSQIFLLRPVSRDIYCRMKWVGLEKCPKLKMMQTLDLA